ncbi:hypothetical protein [Achromobacter sp. E1]|uniref:hypothetical protein n=1 Tax=Achromobacter sp. E1 TaxID=3141581 RepID=UPI0030D404A2
MRPTPARATVPYFCQWESAHRAGEIIRGDLALADDPAWRNSGALDLDEYVRWASHVCGMACLKMVLAARTGHAYPTLELARRSLSYGAYVEEPDGSIRGLIYAPFVQYVAEVFGMRAHVRVDLPASGLPELMARADYFMASVHPSIRWPAVLPAKKGGHLVLVTRATPDAVTFHNPSGEPGSQADVELPLADFDRFYAGRGVEIPPAG